MLGRGFFRNRERDEVLTGLLRQKLEEGKGANVASPGPFAEHRFAAAMVAPQPGDERFKRPCFGMEHPVPRIPQGERKGRADHQSDFLKKITGSISNPMGIRALQGDHQAAPFAPGGDGDRVLEIYCPTCFLGANLPIFLPEDNCRRWATNRYPATIASRPITPTTARMPIDVFMLFPLQSRCRTRDTAIRRLVGPLTGSATLQRNNSPWRSRWA